ncbi:MAG: hypothetical protein H0W72_09520 [Planctomycetes bacterium]|nr:hypothetical protein [Planctomycetota bacterium]
MVTHSYCPWNAHGEFHNAWHRSDRATTIAGLGGSWWPNYCQGWTSLNNLASYCIRHGADSNGNGVYDRGPVRASARLRATSIARFIAYDPRIYLQSR